MRNRIIFILGPTSSGKTKVAIEVAKKMNGEIVSCDSMQVYKDMDVLTQVPGDVFLNKVPHHLIKVVSPEQEFNAAKFVNMAQEVIDNICKKGKMPVFAGGTGLYVKALVDGMFPAPPKDETLREELLKLAKKMGNEYLYSELEKVDPDTAARLHSNDLRRIVRALEIFKLTGKTMQEKKSETRGITENYDCRMFGLSLPRKMLYERIENTVDKMFREGLVAEIEKLRTRKLSLTAARALGIKEVSAYLDGEISFEKAEEELKKNTRRYAKRQLTWFRSDNRIEWIDADRDAALVADEIVNKAE
ncbi:MAG: tRNA (adenosine(37)-N6)-dimethylallyltransferase MiaA [Candidatus Omnitrophota bacterium]